MPIFQGSLVDGLLDELSTRLSHAPELIEAFNISDVRFHLGVLVADKQSADRRRLFDAAAGTRWSGDSDEEEEDFSEAAACADMEAAACADALEQCDDHALEVLLECNASWYADGDGWIAHDPAEPAASEANDR